MGLLQDGAGLPSAPPGREEEEEEEEKTSCAMAAHGAGVTSAWAWGKEGKGREKIPQGGMRVGCSQGAQGRVAMRREEHPKAG